EAPGVRRDGGRGGGAREALRPCPREVARLDAERGRDAGVAAADVAHDREARALHALEHDRLVAALLDIADERGDLEARVDFFLDARDAALPLEPRQELTQTLDHSALHARRILRRGACGVKGPIGAL